MRRVPLMAVVAGAGCAGAGLGTGAARAPALVPQTSGVTVVLQAVSAPTARVAWVSGHGGVVLRTTDGGARWTRRLVPGADSLQFRDVHARDAQTAWVLAAGPGTRSRIYRTDDGGDTWALQFANSDSSAFYDCFAFWDERRAVAFSDAVDGRFVVRVTADGGGHWEPVPHAALPPAQRGEGAFAASGACVVTAGPRHAWIGTGAADTARVLRTADGGRTWDSAAVPVPGGTFAGLAALAFRDTLRGVALGGDLGDPAGTGPAVALTDDGGRTWRLGARPAFAGAVYGAALVPGTVALVAVGPGGMSWSADGGSAWAALDSVPYWSVGFATARRVGWAVGPGGRITRLTVP